MTTRVLNWVVLGVALATLAATFLLPQSSGASTLLTVSLHPTASIFEPGNDAAVLVRAEGEDPEFADYRFSVDNGRLVSAVVPNAVRKGLAEGMVYVRRDTPGTATVRVHVGGVEAAAAVVVFERGAPSTQAASAIVVRVTLDAAVHASARTWRFEVVDGNGQVVATVSAGTSGDAPTGTAATQPLGAGAYVVRQVLGNDTKLGCTTGAFYQVVSPPGGSMSVIVPGSPTAQFLIRPCPGAPTDIGVSRPVDPVATPESSPTPIDEVRGARDERTPFAPGAGTGIASTEDGLPMALIVLGGLLLGVSGISLARLARQSHRR